MIARLASVLVIMATQAIACDNSSVSRHVVLTIDASRPTGLHCPGSGDCELVMNWPAKMQQMFFPADICITPDELSEALALTP